MIVAIRTKAGKLVAFMDAPVDQIRLNVPRGGRFEEVDAERMARGGDPPPGQALKSAGKKLRAPPRGRPARRRE